MSNLVPRTEVRRIDLDHGITDLTLDEEPDELLIHFVRGSEALGEVTIHRPGRRVGRQRLAAEAVSASSLLSISPANNFSEAISWSKAYAPMDQALLPGRLFVSPIDVDRPRIDLAEGLPDEVELGEDGAVDCYVQGRFVGSLFPGESPASSDALAASISNDLAYAVLDPSHHDGSARAHNSLVTSIAELGHADDILMRPLPTTVSVDVVVATKDRPDDLERCLTTLVAELSSGRDVQIFVVDNNPSSGLAKPIVERFPDVTYLEESRQGASYARNRGAVTGFGDIIVTVDDDTTQPPGWLEELITPFSDSMVGAVTGNVLARSLESESEVLFEKYGALGRGYHVTRYTPEWFEEFRDSPPTWDLGATANAAFRREVFESIGGFDESLGTGTPAPCSEDTAAFYDVLASGWHLVYNGRAFVLHRHRGTMEALEKQLYDYSTGGTAYFLRQLAEHGDVRSIRRLAYELPKSYMWRVRNRDRQDGEVPLDLMALEVKGVLRGFTRFGKARRRRDQLGRVFGGDEITDYSTGRK